MWWIFLIIVLVILLIIGLILMVIVYHLQYWKFRQIPHESPKKISELIRDIAKHVGTTAIENEEERFKELYFQFKSTGIPFCGFYHLLQPRVLVLDRELVKQILIKNFSNFNSRGIYYNGRDDPLSADLWSRSGNSWKNMRLKMHPIFQKDQMRHLFECVYAQSEQLLCEIETALKYQERSVLLDMKRLVKRYVLSTIASCVFGLSTQALQTKYPLNEFEAATALILHTRRHDIVLNAMLTRFNKLARKLHFSTTNRKVANYFITLIEDVVAEREKTENRSEETTHDYLQLLIDIRKQELATYEIDEDIDAKQLKENLNKELAADIIGFLKTGFEPTANTLSYVLYELALNEWVQDRARKEVLDVIESHNNEFCYDAVQEMKFLGQVISETIRVNPIMPFLIRCTLTDYHVPSQPKYVIRKNMYVIIPTHVMHNDPENYANPQQFDPERFSKQENKIREQSVWLGFGEGPRSCIGILFAQLQMRVAIARLLQQYKFTLNASRIVQKNEPGIYLRIEPLTRIDADEVTEASVLI